MIDYIIKYWVGAAFGVIVTALYAGWRYVQKRFSDQRLAQEMLRKAQEAEQEALRNGMKALLRDRIVQCYNNFMDKEYCPIYARDSVQSLYKSYHELGGNGTIDNLMPRLMALPTEKPDEE